MEIVKFAFNGANKEIPPQEIIGFLEDNPYAEIGFGVSRQNSDTDMPLWRYLTDLADRVAPGGQGGNYGEVRGIALHVWGRKDDCDASWPAQMARGLLPKGLEQLSYAFPNMCLQINFGNLNIGLREAEDFHYSGLLKRLRDCCLPGGEYGYYNNVTFTFQYNDDTKGFIEAYHEMVSGNNYRVDGMDTRFNLLYDDSHGKGVVPKKYRPPVFKDLLQGYCGGIGEDNVEEVVKKIAAAQTDSKAKVYLDAEGKVRSADGKHLDLDKAARLYAKALDLGLGKGR